MKMRFNSRNSRLQRRMLPVDPRVLDVFPEDVSLWYETKEEIDAGLAWGLRKKFLLRWLRRHMRQQLSPVERRCMELYIFAALPGTQTARKLHVSNSSVGRILRRSLRKLREAARNDPSWRDPDPKIRR